MRTLNYDETLTALQHTIDRECEATTERINALSRAAELTGEMEIASKNSFLVLIAVMHPLSRDVALQLMTPKERIWLMQWQLIAGLAGVSGPNGYITTPQTQLALAKEFGTLLVADSMRALQGMREAGIPIYSPDSPTNPVGDALLIIAPEGTRAVKLTRAALTIYIKWLNRVALTLCGKVAGIDDMPLSRVQRDAVIDEWMKLESHIALYKAKLFILDNELLDAIENTIVYPTGEELKLPFPSVWVEPAHRGDCSYSGWSFCELLLMVHKNLRGHVGLLNFKKPPYTSSVDTYTPNDTSMWYAQETYRGYDDDGIVLSTISGDDLITCKSSKFPIRIIKYLTSKNITYELQTRPYRGSSKAKKKRPPKPYHITEVRKEYVLRLRDQIATGTGQKLERRVNVQRHKVRYRYCPNCDKRRTIKELLKEEPCKECGAVTFLRNAKMVVKWRGPFEKGPDVDDQALRQLYRFRKP